jgi:hypothetical protein
VAVLTGPSVPPADAAAATALVGQLSSPDYRAREKAGRALVELGDRGLPALRAALKTAADPEAQRRLEVLVRRVNSERLGRPRLVTLRLKDKTAKEAVAELARQAGYTLNFQANPEKARYSFDLVGVPFWEALDKVCDAAGLTAYAQNDDGAISLSSNDAVNPYTCYSGPFKLVATNINTGRNLQIGGLQRAFPLPRQPEYLGISFSLFSEPKAPIVGIGQPLVLAATDDTGTSLLSSPEPDPNQRESQYAPQPYQYRSYNQSVGVGLVRPNPKSTTVKELRGTVAVLVLAEVRPELTVENLLSVKKQTFRGQSIDLDVVATDYQNDSLTLDLAVRRRHGNPDDYNWINLLTQRLEVADAAGQRYQFNGTNEQSVGTNTATLKLVFGAHTNNGKKAGKPTRLQYVEWVTATKAVTFAFKDIPLP